MTSKSELVRQLRDMRPVGSLILLPDDPRHGDVGAISESFRRFGQQKPIVIDHDGVILAGNHMYKAAVSLGWDEVWVNESELEGVEKAGYVLADNRTGDLATYDHDALLRYLEEQPDLLGTGYDGDDLDELLDEARRNAPEVDGQLIEPPADPVTAFGDTWLLGDHILTCADVFQIELLPTFAAVIADPPYGMSLDTEYRKMHEDGDMGIVRNYRPVIGDDQPFDPSPLLATWKGVDEQFWFGGDYYRQYLDGGSWLVWDKRVDEVMDAVYGSGFELIWTKQSHKRRILREQWVGAYGMQDDDGKRRLHPTQKPVRLLENLILDFTESGSLLADPFAGSGSTLIAAQRAGRRSWNVEIDPAYCDVIVERFRTAFPDQSVQRQTP